MTVADLIACPGCGKDNDGSHAFCCQCGKSLRESGAAPAAAGFFSLRWRWVCLSFVLIAGTVSITGVLLDMFYVGLGGGEFADLLADLTFGIGMVLGGVVAGYSSPGVTIKEPALAAALLTALFAASGHLYAGASWMWLLAFLLAMAGAWLGEKMQGTI